MASGLDIRLFSVNDKHPLFEGIQAERHLAQSIQRRTDPVEASLNSGMTILFDNRKSPDYLAIKAMLPATKYMPIER